MLKTTAEHLGSDILQVVSRPTVSHHGSLQEKLQEVWTEVACVHGIYRITAGLMGCDVGVVVAEFPDRQSAYEFAVGFRIGKASLLMHGPEWQNYVGEIHKWRKFDTATLQNLLSLSPNRS